MPRARSEGPFPGLFCNRHRFEAIVDVWDPCQHQSSRSFVLIEVEFYIAFIPPRSSFEVMRMAQEAKKVAGSLHDYWRNSLRWLYFGGRTGFREHFHNFHPPVMRRGLR